MNKPVLSFVMNFHQWNFSFIHISKVELLTWGNFITTSSWKMYGSKPGHAMSETLTLQDIYYVLFHPPTMSFQKWLFTHYDIKYTPTHKLNITVGWAIKIMSQTHTFLWCHVNYLRDWHINTLATRFSTAVAGQLKSATSINVACRELEEPCFLFLLYFLFFMYNFLSVMQRLLMPQFLP